MKKIILIGDSIRMGYEPTVRQELEGIADVWAPEVNGQHSVNLLLQFNEWVAKREPDILHINAGLWDLRNVMRGAAGNVVPVEAYRQNVARLLDLAKQHVKSKIIWATSTPVNIAHNLANHAATGHPGRSEGDVERYNAAATAVCREAGIEINDLYDFVQTHDPNAIRLPDGVHYTLEGYALLGRHVADLIRKHL